MKLAVSQPALSPLTTRSRVQSRLSQRFENMARKFVGALCTIGLMLWAGTVAATPAGTVVVVSGSWTDHGRMLNRGDAVQIGDTFDVPADGYLKLQMADGSIISVAPDSNATVTSYSINGSGRDAKLSLTRGALRAQVPSTTGPSIFEVSTAGGTALVDSASADWFVKVQPESVQVGVLAGTIDLRSALTGDSVSIPARWGTRLETGLDPVLPRVWAQSEFNAVIRLTGT
jgi:ferric-dicitrate binding protein FerR (iron transport regulator)